MNCFHLCSNRVEFVDSAGSSIKGVEAMFHLEIRRNPFMNLLVTCYDICDNVSSE